MATRIEAPKVIAAAGNKPKRLEELIGLASSGTGGVSAARMVSPPHGMPDRTPPCA